MKGGHLRHNEGGASGDFDMCLMALSTPPDPVLPCCRKLIMSTGSEHETMLSDYLQDHATSGKPALMYVLGHPRRSLSAYVALHQLPRLSAALTDTVEGAAIRDGLSRWSPLGRTVFHSATSVLLLPADREQYHLGASKQTLRRKVRAAEKLGVHWAKVDNPQEQRRLLTLANDHERTNPDPEYRQTKPDNNDLLEYRLWLVAYSRDDQPILLSVTPVDGEWALLSYFVTLGTGPEHSNARYLMTQVLVEHLIGAGVRYLADESSPIRLRNGLRHFQRMLGFRIFRVSLTSPQGRGRRGDRLTLDIHEGLAPARPRA
jgi:hypothetical protein